VALHSILIGALMVIQPSSLIKLMGFGRIGEPFFPCHGGVFHILMAVAYLCGAADIHKNRNMIVYAIMVKMTAAMFLFSYYFFAKNLWIVFLSGSIDLGMGIIIWNLLSLVEKDSKKRSGYEQK
jgi:hypothetical protein